MERIAVSLVVNERRRLDIPLSAVIRVDALAVQSFADGRRVVTFDQPHVRIWLMPNLQRRLYDFTRGSVDAIMEVFVDDQCVTRPVLREPLGTEPSFQIFTADFDEACALADKLRVGWRPVSLGGAKGRVGQAKCPPTFLERRVRARPGHGPLRPLPVLRLLRARSNLMPVAKVAGRVVRLVPDVASLLRATC